MSEGNAFELHRQHAGVFLQKEVFRVVQKLRVSIKCAFFKSLENVKNWNYFQSYWKLGLPLIKNWKMNSRKSNIFFQNQEKLYLSFVGFVLRAEYLMVQRMFEYSFICVEWIFLRKHRVGIRRNSSRWLWNYRYRGRRVVQLECIWVGVQFSRWLLLSWLRMLAKRGEILFARILSRKSLNCGLDGFNHGFLSDVVRKCRNLD